MRERSDLGSGKVRLVQRLRDSASAIKKTLNHPKVDEVARTRFQATMVKYEYFDQRPIVYVDESGFALDAPRTHGYTQKGKRCYGRRDWHAKGRLNAIGAILNFEL